MSRCWCVRGARSQVEMSGKHITRCSHLSHKESANPNEHLQRSRDPHVTQRGSISLFRNKITLPILHHGGREPVTQCYLDVTTMTAQELRARDLGTVCERLVNLRA